VANRAFRDNRLPVAGPLLAFDFRDMAAKGTVSATSITPLVRCTARHGVHGDCSGLRFAAFGNYVVPLQIGAPDIGFFLGCELASYRHLWWVGDSCFRAFSFPGGPAQAGWTSIRRWQRLISGQWTDLLAYRHGMPNHRHPFGRGQFISQPLFSFGRRE